MLLISCRQVEPVIPVELSSFCHIPCCQGRPAIPVKFSTVVPVKLSCILQHGKGSVDRIGFCSTSQALHFCRTCCIFRVSSRAHCALSCH
ncbi:hypothetical protein BDZ91DRAFT_746944 [Kalaharituber pfeilii]|nr:hypothetical protein BDZ91DRAFT_746944 [Kalaharituber pfeilii]